MFHAVIMAGGQGTRFWPRSRRDVPKQFLALLSERTMIEESVGRIEDLFSRKSIYVVTVGEQAEVVRKRVAGLDPQKIIVEPEMRNTAACIGLAAVHILHRDDDATMAVMPSDHMIRPSRNFIKTLALAEIVARRKGAFVTIGAPAREPATGFGYIERGDELMNAGGRAVYRVASFREKPDRATAERYVEQGRYYWNCGIFVWRVADLVAAFKEHLPQHYNALMRIRDALDTPRADEVTKSEYSALESISIDYGLMEKVHNVAVVPADFEWDDVGSWAALRRLCPADHDGNVISGRHCGVDTTDCVVAGSEEYLVATVGVSDLVIVVTPDAALVCHRDRAEDVRQLIGKMADEGLDRYL